MGVVINPESDLAKEMCKHEMLPSKYTGDAGPGNPWKGSAARRGEPGYPYPRMLYKAQKKNGRIQCRDVAPHPMDYGDQNSFERASLAVATFNAQCEKIVQSEAEYENARSQGWRDTAPEAETYLAQLDQDIANAAAETAFHAKGMSAKAKAELAEADASTDKHVTDVRGIPKARRGRKPKSETVQQTKG